MKLVNLIKYMNSYTLKLFNTGQITLPKAWRDKFNTNHFLAKETKNGLLIEPIKEKELVYYKGKNKIGLYCEKGLPVDDIIRKIDELHGSD